MTACKVDIRPNQNQVNQNVGIFVIPNIPFIGYRNTNNKPLVGNKSPFDRYFGFTITELAVTVLVVAILGSIALHTMRDAFENNRIITQTNSLISDINLARDQALGRGVVVICTSSDAASCNGAGWTSGRLMFVDSSPNDYAFTPGTDRMLRYTEPLPTGSIQVLSTTFPDPLIFNAQGTVINIFNARVMSLATAPGAGSSLNFVLCGTYRAAPGRTIEIKTNGTPVVSPAVCP